MTVPMRLDALLARRLRALVRQLPAAMALHVEGVHRARVASRRIREILPVFDAALPEQRLRKARRRVRRVTRALGPVRELDVALETLDGFARAHTGGREAVEAVRRRLVGEREAARAWMRHRIGGFDVARFARKLSAAAREADAPGEAPSATWRHRLSVRMTTRAKNLLAAVERAGSLYLPDRLHEVRIAVKKLRYALEVAVEARAAPAAPVVRSLKRTQDVLGRLHDLEVVMAYVQQVQGAADPRDNRLAAAFGELAAALEGECRRLHARYVRRQATLVRAAEAALEEIAPKAGEPVHV